MYCRHVLTHDTTNTVRAHIAIILILTLTIEAFDPEGDVGGGFKVAGDYSAVFPLLTVAVFVALQISRKTTFYEKQRSRGDIMALPEVLCEPGKEGKPLVMDYKGDLHELDESVYGYESDTDDTDSWSSNEKYRAIDGGTSQHDIEAIFEAKNQPRARGFAPPHTARPNHDLPLIRNSSIALSETSSNVPSPLPPRPQGVTISSRRQSRASSSEGSSARATAASSLRTFDDLLDGPIKAIPANEKRHRRTKSEPVQIVEGAKRKKTNRDKMVETSSQRRSAGGVALKRVTSFGQVDQEQPSLLDQARKRAASFDKASESHR